MVQPVQVWMPLSGGIPYDSVLQRDLTRAQQEWRGEDLIWLKPSARRVTREVIPYCDLRYEVLYVPAERFNIISVCHIDEARRLYPCRLAPEAWRRGLPVGLYQRWLNVQPRFVPGEKELTFDVLGQNISLSEVPGTRAMIRLDTVAILDEKTTEVTVGWPPPGFDDVLTPVSPEEEGKELFTALAAERGMDDSRTLRLDWPEPFDLLFPTGGGRDLLHGWFLMHRCVDIWRTGGKDYALQEAEGWVNRLTGQAHGSQAKAWFWPKARANPETALYDILGRFGLDVATVEDALQSEPLQAELSRSVPVRRAHSWLGYFWWELYQDLKAHTPVGYCKDCGNVIRGGRRDREFCTQEESSDCVRQRSRKRQRQHRAKEL